MTDVPKLTSAEELRRRRPPNRERVDTIKRTVDSRSRYTNSANAAASPRSRSRRI